MTARDRILKRLRQAQKKQARPAMMDASSSTGAAAEGGKSRMIPLPAMDAEARLARFISEAEQLGSTVYQTDANEAVEQIMDLLDGDRRVLSWADERLPIADLQAMLGALGVVVAAPDDGNVRVGITGASAALAATGSLVLESGAGRPRGASLLPDLHIALMTPDQLLTDLEDWQAAQKASGYPAFHAASNTVIVSGPSKTADIGHQLVKGAHGPRELHIFILRP